MTQHTTKYLRFRQAGYNAAQSYRAARIYLKWESLEFEDVVRISAAPEQDNYFDVYGRPEGYTNIHGKVISAEQERKDLIDLFDQKGVWIVYSEWFDGADWQMADSVGMCAGYDDPCSPFENCYVVDLMQSAMRELENHQHLTNEAA